MTHNPIELDALGRADDPLKYNMRSEGGLGIREDMGTVQWTDADTYKFKDRVPCASRHRSQPAAAESFFP